MNLADLDPTEIDPEGAGYFERYGSMPDPESIDRQLLQEHRKNTRIKVSNASITFADVALALVLDLVAVPLAYASVVAVVNLGWWGLIVPAIFSPAFASAIVYTFVLFQR